MGVEKGGAGAKQLTLKLAKKVNRAGDILYLFFLAQNLNFTAKKVITVKKLREPVLVFCESTPIQNKKKLFEVPSNTTLGWEVIC